MDTYFEQSYVMPEGQCPEKSPSLQDVEMRRFAYVWLVWGVFLKLGKPARALARNIAALNRANNQAHLQIA